MASVRVVSGVNPLVPVGDVDSRCVLESEVLVDLLSKRPHYFSLDESWRIAESSDVVRITAPTLYVQSNQRLSAGDSLDVLEYDRDFIEWLRQEEIWRDSNHIIGRSDRPLRTWLPFALELASLVDKESPLLPFLRMSSRTVPRGGVIQCGLPDKL